MKRDLDLIRKIILRLAAAEEQITVEEDTCMAEWGVPYPVMLFHAKLLDEVGYVHVEQPIKIPLPLPSLKHDHGDEPRQVHEAATWGTSFHLCRLTWKGCDYADAIVDNTRWTNLKNAIAKKWADIAVAGTLAIVDAGPSIIDRIARLTGD